MYNELVVEPPEARVDDEQQWDATLNDPNSSRMKKLVDQALEDIREGRTEPLDPNKL